MTTRTYPVRFGFKVSVEIVRDTAADLAHVDVIAPIYMNKRWRMNHCYTSSQFSDGQILQDRDFITVLCNHYPAEK